MELQEVIADYFTRLGTVVKICIGVGIAGQALALICWVPSNPLAKALAVTLLVFALMQAVGGFMYLFFNERRKQAVLSQYTQHPEHTLPQEFDRLSRTATGYQRFRTFWVLLGGAALLLTLVGRNNPLLVGIGIGVLTGSLSTGLIDHWGGKLTSQYLIRLGSLRQTAG